MSRYVRYQTAGPLAFLTLTRPEARNALTWEMYQALGDVCQLVERDPEIKVLILRSADDKAFAAGSDISEFTGFQAPHDGPAYEERLDRILDGLERLSKPTVAQVQGAALGGGCVLALTCDICICTPESTFGLPIARTLGNCLSAANYARLLDRVGPAQAKDMVFTGRIFDAQEAAAAGLVNRIVSADAIDRAVSDGATAIASNAPLTIRATKEMIRRILAARRIDPDDGRDLTRMCYASEDFREGVSAFLAKRPPQWKGR